VAQQDFDASSDDQRRRKLIVFLLLLVASLAIGLGGSMYYKQQKAKAEALASQEKLSQGKPEAGLASGAESLNTPEVATPVVSSTEEPAAPTEEKPVLGQRKSKSVAAKKGDDVAAKLLANAPSAAGPENNTLPGSLSAGAVEPGQVAAPQTETPGLANKILEDNPTAAGTEAPVASNNTAPTSTNLPQGGVTTAVPEASTWMMMLAGLGLLAVGVRRKI
jgi:hypothetical protein